MSAKKRQTFNKMNRERAVREKRARKAEKKELKKLAALEGDGGEAPTEVGAIEVGAIEEPVEQ